MPSLSSPIPAQRPYLHFTPPAAWLNDPNGLVYVDGEYHLFYQHHPYSLIWGPMHWGHAVSRDLVHWEHLPVALAPDELGQIFSGSVVVDHHDSAGFGPGAMVAVFTHGGIECQVQSLAYSTDRGRSWTKYAGNPVLEPPTGECDFRDPKVFWYDEGGGMGHWVMVLAAGRSIWIYCSSDLKSWTKTDEVGGRGARGGVWECPDLVELVVDGGPQTRWALMVSVQQGAPAGGSGQQYFVGDFDGERFRPDDGPEVVRWADYGADFYAAQSWNEAPGGRRIWLAWMNNWEYAKQTPATTWRGMMTAPRELSLVDGAAGLVLAQCPARELAAECEATWAYEDVLVSSGRTRLEALRGQRLMLSAAFRAEGASARQFGLRVRVSAEEATTIRYDVARQELAVERGDPTFSIPGFAGRQSAPLIPREGMVALQILLDDASIEIFADHGRVMLTNQIFPLPTSLGVDLFAEGGDVLLKALRAWRFGPSSESSGA